MSKLPFHSIPHGACLIELIVEDFSRRSNEELQQTLLLLPTRRLQLHVAAHLASRAGGATWLPLLMTWDQFVQNESFVYTSNNNMVMVSSLAELILADQLKESEHQGISDGHAHELLHFLKELWRNSKRQDGPEALAGWLERQWQIDPDAIQEIKDRTGRVYSVLDSFDQSLHNHGFSLQEELHARSLDAWIEAIKNGSWRPVSTAKRIVIAGLTSLPENQINLLKSLAQVPGVELWLDTPWRQLSQDAPLRRIRNAIAVPSVAEPEAVSHVSRLQSANDPFAEAAAALERAQTAIDRGAPAHRVAILVPDESQYASILAILSEQMELPRNIPLARPWTATQAGSWFEILQRWVTRHEAVAFAGLLLNPNSRELITRNQSRSSSEFPTFGADFSQFVSSWLENAPKTIESKAIFDLSLSQSNRPEIFAQLFHDTWVLFQGENHHSFNEHANYWQTHFAPHITSRRDAKLDAIERIGWQSILDAEFALREIPVEFLPHTRSWADFIKALVRLAKETTPRETGEPLADLQIISITEARYVPLDVAIIVGCVEGLFPHRVPRDSLIDQTLKSALDLPGWQQLEALEDSTFGLLVSRIPQVELLWPEALNEAATVRSRWVEKIHASGMPIHNQPAKSLTYLFDQRITGSLTSNAASATSTSELEGQVSVEDRETLMTRVSASSLKAFMTCPYQFLMRQRGIRPFSMRDHEDPILMGNLLHRVIELCLRPDLETEAKLPLIARWRLGFTDSSDLEHWSVERLRAISEVIIPKTLRDTPEVLQIIERTWPQLALDWSKIYDLGWLPVHSLVEYKFGTKSEPVTIEVGSRKINVTGAIDVIHRLSATGEWIICDYKSGNAPTPASVRQGLEPQLILYSICLDVSQEGYKASDGVISYRSLKSGTFQTVSVGSEVRGKWSEAFGECRLDLAELISQFKILWQERIGQIESADRFFADTKSCGYCEYSNICRKDDPRYQDRIHLQGGDSSI